MGNLGILYPFWILLPHGKELETLTLCEQTQSVCSIIQENNHQIQYWAVVLSNWCYFFLHSPPAKRISTRYTGSVVPARGDLAENGKPFRVWVILCLLTVHRKISPVPTSPSECPPNTPHPKMHPGVYPQALGNLSFVWRPRKVTSSQEASCPSDVSHFHIYLCVFLLLPWTRKPYLWVFRTELGTWQSIQAPHLLIK